MGDSEQHMFWACLTSVFSLFFTHSLSPFSFYSSRGAQVSQLIIYSRTHILPKAPRVTFFLPHPFFPFSDPEAFSLYSLECKIIAERNPLYLPLP